MNALIFAFAAMLAVANAGLLGLHGAVVVGHAGAGHEGQYIPSGLERLHDDGSYRPEHHLAGHGAVVVGHGLGLGYGLGLGNGLGLGHGLGLGLGLGLRAGDGHEGQYIPSGEELHYDDGSYRGEHHLEGLWH